MAAIDLPRIIKGMALRRRVILFPTFDFPPAIEAGLFKIYVQVPRAWAIQVRNRLMPAFRFEAWYQSPTPGADSYAPGLTEATSSTRLHTRDDLPGLQEELNGIDEQMNRLVLSLTPEMRSWAIKAEAYHRRRFAGAAKTAAGVDLSTVLTFGGVETTVEAVLQRNVSLVRNVSDDIRRSIGDAVFRAFQNRQPRSELAKAINEATGLGKRRSMVIARDQTTKLAAALDRERQEEIGITQFVWRHSGKVHYRPHHLARDGKIYSWKRNNLGGDLPGVAINCGCKAQAYVGELMGEGQAPEAIPAERAAPEAERTEIQPVPIQPRTFDPVAAPGRNLPTGWGEGVARWPVQSEPAFPDLDPPALPPPSRLPAIGIREARPTGKEATREGRREVFDQAAFDGMGIRSVLTGTRSSSPALSSYTGGGYTNINGALRRGESVTRGLTSSIKEIDDIIAQSPPLKRDAILWRGISTPVRPKVGDEVGDQGYWSTSINPSVARNFGATTYFRITVPEGTRTFMIQRGGRDLTQALDDEAEVLLPRGSRFRVTAVEKVGVDWITDITLIPP